jgi:heterodisulfide reductase subunit A-like polyferredoxin
MPGVNVQVSDKCTGCGICTKGICFVNAIELTNKKSVIDEKCRGCGRCISICPQQAIEIKIEDDKYIEASIKELDRIINVS